jgi:hypothetical protein
MSSNLFSSEIIGLLTQDEREYEVCASAEGTFDETRCRLTVELDSFLRAADIRGPEKRAAADWLPRPETVKESVSREEASEVMKDIFRRWVGKVRQSIPVPIHN